MISELKKHVDLKTFFIAKKLTPEIKDFCGKLNVRFEKRKRFINPLRLFFEFRLLINIKRQKADLVWFNTLSFIQAILLKLIIRKPLITAHDVEVHPEDTDYHGILSQKLTFILFKKNIAVMSRSQSDLFEKKYGFRPYLLQLPIIDYYEASAALIDLKTEVSQKVSFLFFGSIQPYKGIEILLEAAEILNSKNIEYGLNICGRIRYKHDKIQDAIDKLKNVYHINKHIDYKEIYELYNSSDVVVITYTHVTQSGPLLIGYNQNKPCITNDLPGFREYVDDGKSGLIFSKSAAALAAKMEELIGNRNKIYDMGIYISEYIKSRFSMSSLAISYVKVFEEHIG